MSNGVDFVFKYHDQTKHRPGRYARSLGYMDWATQPNPFRQFEGAPHVVLEHPSIDKQVSYDDLFRPDKIVPAVLNRLSISRLFYDSLAISAWKQAPGTPPWSLRINPSSGCLHPTEGYLIAGQIDDLTVKPAVCHYSPLHHVLEQRVTIGEQDWAEIATQLPKNALLVALTSIYWRESWKYGERAFRYCHHDVGHAIGTVAIAAATLGWETKLIETINDERLGKLLGVACQTGVEAEHPDCLLVIYPKMNAPLKQPLAFELSAELMNRLSLWDFAGTRNVLSPKHHPWPVIDEVSRETTYAVGASSGVMNRESLNGGVLNPVAHSDRKHSAQGIIRQRRSAVSMDGRTAISQDDFYLMLRRTMPGHLPLDTLPWRPRVSLALFVHRVTGLSPGLYLLVRDPRHVDDLRQALRGDFLWTKPPDCPADLPLVLLSEGDFRDTAKLVSCQQDIAADGAFSLGMLAQFQSSLAERGASMYPRLFWETGLIGQVLYLEAEAAGVRATGIGCFFDDVMHELLGIDGHQWQSLYHFTVGGQVEDLRIQTIPPYKHLE